MSDRIGPILDAVVARIAGRGFTLAGVALPALKRKAAVRRETLDPPAMITVAKSAAPEEVSRWRFGAKRTDYRVDVVLHAPYLGPDADVSEYHAIRDEMADDFSKPPLIGAADVFDLRARPADWLRPLGEQTGYDWFAVEVTASVVSAN